MGFKENLLKKIHIDQLADEVIHTMGTPANPQRIEREKMRDLLAHGSYAYHHERDLDLYFIGEEAGKKLILVLDNELKIYHTDEQDVALRKSPTIKEMVNIRNAIKILNDKDVVVSSKSDTVRRIQTDLIGDLDLSYTAADLEEIEREGRESLANAYAEGVIEALLLFAELLTWQKAPPAFQAPHHRIWGALRKDPAGSKVVFGPMVLYNLTYNALKLIRLPLDNFDKAAMQHFQQIVKGQAKAEMEGEAVLSYLKIAALENRPAS